MNNLQAIKSGLFGVVVGDALGVPVEFSSRSEREADPVTDMREFGTHNQPKAKRRAEKEARANMTLITANA